ncbi:MAG: hypothetical protein ACYDAC_11870 [Candidatus Dormibacteria bacterium]
MSGADVDRIVAATLYEGYILYPYRPTSVKNQVRWTFGGVYPRAYSEHSGGTERHTVTTECLLRGGDHASVDVEVRFLHLVARSAARARHPSTEAPPLDALDRVDSFTFDGRVHRTWEEATERTVTAGRCVIGELLAAPRHLVLAVDGGEEVEWLRDSEGVVGGALLRSHQPLAVAVDIHAVQVHDDLTRLRVDVCNVTGIDTVDREAALHHALLSTHVVLRSHAGSWLSLADPPEDARDAATSATNDGLWPIVVGPPGSADTILASPIILEDHPELAAESPGDLFDATEIDEILSLRILTLTDAEKAEMRGADERARAILERTEALTGDDWMRMHGTLRPTTPRIGATLPPEPAGGLDPWITLGDDPFAERPLLDAVPWQGGTLRAGDHVRLVPKGGADALDIVLRGRTATVESLEQDVDNRVYVAVTVDDDPGADLGVLRQPGHRFFYQLDEVEPVGEPV